jgi:hypothetical protein
MAGQEPPSSGLSSPSPPRSGGEGRGEGALLQAALWAARSLTAPGQHISRAACCSGFPLRGRGDGGGPASLEGVQLLPGGSPCSARPATHETALQRRCLHRAVVCCRQAARLPPAAVSASPRPHSGRGAGVRVEPCRDANRFAPALSPAPRPLRGRGDGGGPASLDASQLFPQPGAAPLKPRRQRPRPAGWSSPAPRRSSRRATHG